MENLNNGSKVMHIKYFEFSTLCKLISRGKLQEP